MENKKGFEKDNASSLNDIILKYQVTQIYYLAAILSANGKKNPSSIAVYGENAPKLNTPEDYVLEPSTVYGNSKVAGENWANYYFKKYGLDIRSIRYPGVIGYQSLPGGGTTDYAVEIYHKAINHMPFNCFLEAETKLPMIYMDNCYKINYRVNGSTYRKN